MSHARNPVPIGVWREITRPLRTIKECEPWANEIEARGLSEVKIERCKDEMGRARWCVLAMRLPPGKKKVGKQTKKKKVGIHRRKKVK